MLSTSTTNQTIPIPFNNSLTLQSNTATNNTVPFLLIPHRSSSKGAKGRELGILYMLPTNRARKTTLRGFPGNQYTRLLSLGILVKWAALFLRP